jgi:hypothetical protein
MSQGHPVSHRSGVRSRDPLVGRRVGLVPAPPIPSAKRNRALAALHGGATGPEAAQTAGVSLSTVRRLQRAQRGKPPPPAGRPMVRRAPPPSPPAPNAEDEDERDLFAELRRVPDVVLATLALDATPERGAAMTALFSAAAMIGREATEDERDAALVEALAALEVTAPGTLAGMLAQYRPEDAAATEDATSSSGSAATPAMGRATTVDGP